MPGGTFFEALAHDNRTIGIDCDVVVGHWPPRADLDTSEARVAELLARGGIASAVVTDAQRVWLDEASGADRAFHLADARHWFPSPAVNLRDLWRVEERLDEWAARGARAVRVPMATQGIGAGSPGIRRLVESATDRKMVLLTEGAFSAVQQAFRGMGASVVFLDISYYETADFLISASEEPGFVASTRKLLGPDSIEIIAGEVGASHLAFGSGVPLQDLEPSVWRLRDARLAVEEFAAVAGGTITGLMERS